MAQKRVQERYAVCQEYIITRGKALTFPASQFRDEIGPDTVYGAVIDMPMGPNVLTTMVCFINGAANLYFNLGGDYSGAALKYPSLVQTTRAFIANANQFLEISKKTTQYDLPKGRTHYIYLLTKNGIYKTELIPTEIQNDPQKRLLLAMYQRIMSELRTAQLKDQAAKQ